MKSDTLDLPVNTLESEPESNMMKVRDRETIDKIEESFASGVLSEALRKAPQIERRSKLSIAEFVEQYRKKLKPVVVEGLMNEWPALQKWNWNYLVRKCGDAQVVVDS